LQVLGGGGALGGPARPGVNFGGNPPNLGAAPHDWGFAKKAMVKLLKSNGNIIISQTMLLSNASSF